MKVTSCEKRLNAVKEILEKYLISDQKVLVSILKKEFDIEIAQSLVSRDLRKLGAIKRQMQGGIYYSLSQKNVKMEVLHQAIRNVRYNESLIIIQTEPGMAAIVGDYLDEELSAEFLGCIAGENVVFVAPPSIKKIAVTCERICQALNYQTAVNLS